MFAESQIPLLIALGHEKILFEVLKGSDPYGQIWGNYAKVGCKEMP